MALPTPFNTCGEFFSLYVKSLAAADSPTMVFPFAGSVRRIWFTPTVTPTTSTTTITPKIAPGSTGTLTQMQLNGSNQTMLIPITVLANESTFQDFNGLNRFNEGDVLLLTSDAGAANAASVEGSYTVIVDTRSI